MDVGPDPGATLTDCIQCKEGLHAQTQNGQQTPAEAIAQKCNPATNHALNPTGYQLAKMGSPGQEPLMPEGTMHLSKDPETVSGNAAVTACSWAAQVEVHQRGMAS